MALKLKKAGFPLNRNKKMWQQDLKKGNQSEKEFAQWLVDEHGFQFIEFNNDDRYDIKAKKPFSTPVTYEVKTDFTKTGNLAIEHSCLKRQKLTGLYSTQANWFVYIKNKRIYFFKPNKLKNYIANNDIKVVRGGDKNSVTMFLLKEKEAETLATKVVDKLY